MPNGRRLAGVIRSQANVTGLRLECAMVLHESLLVPVLMYVSDTMIWKEKERSRIKAVQMNNFRGLPGIRRMDKVLSTRIRVLSGVTSDGLMRVFSDCSVIWRGWGMTGLLRCNMWGSVLVLVQWVGRGRDG